MRTPTPYWVCYKGRYTGKHVLRKFECASDAHVFCAAVRNILDFSTAYVHFTNG